MAISENTFTPEELETAIKTTPALIEHIKSVLPKSNLVITPKSEFDSLEAKYIGTHTAKIAKEIEDNIGAITGIKKIDDNEKWTEYYQRAPKELKTQLDLKTKEIEELKKGSTIEEAERQKLKNQEVLLAKQTTDIETLKTTHSSEIHKLKVGNQILSDIVPVRETFIKEPKIAKAIEVMHNQSVNWMLENSKIDENSGLPIYFAKQADGTSKAMFDDKGGYKTSAQVYSDLMKDFVDEGRQIKGAGGQGGLKIDGLPATITTQDQLGEYLNSKGLIGGTTEYTTQFNKYSALLKR